MILACYLFAFKPSPGVDACFCEGFGMARGEIEALRANVEGRIQGSGARSQDSAVRGQREK